MYDITRYVLLVLLQSLIRERRSTFNHLTTWLTDARNQTHPNTTILLIGNKTDMPTREVPYDEAARFAEENGKDSVHIFMCVFMLYDRYSIC